MSEKIYRGPITHGSRMILHCHDCDQFVAIGTVRKCCCGSTNLHEPKREMNRAALAIEIMDKLGFTPEEIFTAADEKE